ncbi:hypothetical protein [Clostridium paraputrificum]|uniref:hypothetical protein n=1 Tax=Clostridium paraputrificum TaxID=29363 RepID=UPI00248166F3|nr:hypothetical protein [Clostridium paraputrificum]MDB2086881.1 hypothetical protein [Clostridium paraputrificum]
MKRKLSMLLSGFLVLILVGCGGSKKYEPNLAEMGMVNADEKYTNQYGVRDNLNIKGVTKKEDIIEVKTESPIENVIYANKEHLSVSIIDEEGKEYSDLSVVVTNNEGNAILYIEGNDINKGKYLRVMPYKTRDGNFAEYEIK